eukprot:3137489-Amphidinium_carterae.1
MHVLTLWLWMRLLGEDLVKVVRRRLKNHFGSKEQDGVCASVMSNLRDDTSWCMCDALRRMPGFGESCPQLSPFHAQAERIISFCWLCVKDKAWQDSGDYPQLQQFLDDIDSFNTYTYFAFVIAHPKLSIWHEPWRVKAQL